MLFIFIFFFSIIFNYDKTMNSVYSALEVWLYNIYPSLFLLYIVSFYFIQNKLFNKFSLILKPFISFEYNKSYSIILTSIILGNPGTINLAKVNYKDNNISYNDYQKIIYLSIFMNPLFVISFLDFKLYIYYLISSLITIFIFDKFKRLNKKNINGNNSIYTYQSFISSITSIINVLLMVACLSVLFSVLKESISFLLYKVNINLDILLSFLEIGTGLKYLTSNNQLTLSIFLIAFQGLCIIIQSFNIIKDTSISFTKYIFVRLIQALITTLIFFLIYSCFSSSSNELFYHFKIFTNFHISFNVMTYNNCTFI